VKVCETLNVFAGRRPDGSTVLEEVVVEALESGRYRLEQSPGLVMGIAAGDVFELTEERKAVVLERGGNLCIQVYHPPGDATDLERALTERLQPLGGRLDGRSRWQVVYTVPVAVGFKAVEAVLNATVAEFSGAEWYYANVYDNDDGITPLNWWVPS
jgi:hypothetical protein